MPSLLGEIKALKNLMKFIKIEENRRTICFFSEGESYWPHLSGLLKSLLEKFNHKICYVSSSINDPGLLLNHKNLNTFFIGDNYVRDYFFQNLSTNILVMTTPNLNHNRIKLSKKKKVHYIYVQHSLASLHMIYPNGSFDYYDTICCAGPHHVNEISTLYKGKKKKNILKIGYSRLDALIKDSKSYKTNPKSKKTILIAPSWGPQGIIESGLCFKLIKELLKAQFKVILRPHQQTMKISKKLVNKIINKFNNNHNFQLEDNVKTHLSYFDSDIMISDWSGAAIEYAFSLGKPVIYCDLPKKINNLNYKKIGIVPLEVFIRNEIGIIWDMNSPITDIITKCDRKIIKFKSEKYVFNLNNSDFIFAKYINELNNSLIINFDQN